MDTRNLAIVERICTRFESAWLTHKSPQLEDFLTDSLTPELREIVLEELLALDIEYRQKKDETPQAREYRDRFPGDDDVISHVFRQMDRPVNETESVSGEAAPSTSNGANGSGRGSDKGSGIDSCEMPSQPGRYQWLRKIGEGGFGQVYLAQDDVLHRQVAIKASHNNLFASSEAAERFLREARTAVQLRHKGIVPVFDVIHEGDDQVFIVMEYIEQGPLNTNKLSQDQSPVDSARMIASVADTVHFAHTQGFVHRDLKPHNIVIDGNGDPIVADFGLALHESEQQGRAGEVSGTPYYMSPEQVCGLVHRLDGRTDIWSLGVILYEVLTGRRPFNGKSKEEIFDEILNRDPKPPRQINDSIPEQLERVCLKALSKQQSDRYLTARDMAEDLHLAIDGELPPPTPPAKTPSPVGPILKKAAAVGAAIGLVVSIALAIWLFPDPPDSNPPPPPPPPPLSNYEFDRTFPQKHHSQILALAVTENGEYVASGDEQGVVWLWRVTTDETIALHSQHLNGMIRDLRFSSDGQRLAALTSEDKRIHLWSVPDFQPLRTITTESQWPDQLLPSRHDDSLCVLVQSPGKIELRDVASGAAEREFSIQQQSDYLVAAYTAEALAIAVYDHQNGKWVTHLWRFRDPKTMDEPLKLELSSPVNTLSLGPNGSLAVGCYGPTGGIQRLVNDKLQYVEMKEKGQLFYHHVSFDESGELLLAISQKLPTDSKPGTGILQAKTVTDDEPMYTDVAETGFSIGAVAIGPKHGYLLLSSENEITRWKLPWFRAANSSTE